MKGIIHRLLVMYAPDWVLRLIRYRIQCPGCDQIFPDRQTAIRHVLTDHPEAL